MRGHLNEKFASCVAAIPVAFACSTQRHESTNTWQKLQQKQMDNDARSSAGQRLCKSLSPSEVDLFLQTGVDLLSGRSPAQMFTGWQRQFCETTCRSNCGSVWVCNRSKLSGRTWRPALVGQTSRSTMLWGCHGKKLITMDLGR